MFKSFLTYLFAFFYLLNSGCTNQDPNATQIIHDTIYLNKKSGDTISAHQLTGTTVLKGSSKNMDSRWAYGLWLDDFTSSECLQLQSETPSRKEITSVRQ